MIITFPKAEVEINILIRSLTFTFLIQPQNIFPAKLCYKNINYTAISKLINVLAHFAFLFNSKIIKEIALTVSHMSTREKLS